MAKRNIVTQDDFIKSCDKIMEEKNALAAAKIIQKVTILLKSYSGKIEI